MASKRSGYTELSRTSSSLLYGLKCQQNSSWVRLIDMYGTVVYRRCRRCGMCVEDAEDVVQEVFTAVNRSIVRYQPMVGKASFRKWLGTITTNKLRDYWRKNLTIPSARGGTNWHRFLQSVEDDLADGSVSSSVSGEKAEESWAEIVHAVRAETSLRDWGIFEGVIMENRTPADVAIEFKVTTNVVYLVRSRLLRKMRELVGAGTV